MSLGDPLEVEERPAAVPPAGTSTTTWPALVGRVVLLYAASRLVALAGAAVVMLTQPGQTLAAVLTQWDGEWYLAVVRDGYPGDLAEVEGTLAPNTSAFFPLYPLLVRAADVVLPGGDIVAAIAVASLLGATATVGVAVLAQLLAGRAVAERAAALFCFFPGAIVFSMAYTEGLMVTAAAACLVFLHRRQWWAAGLAAALAGASRPTAVVLVASCAWAAAVAIRRRREFRALTAPVLAPVGIIAFHAFLWARTGLPDAWSRTSREVWMERRDFGLTTAKVAGRFVTGPFEDVDTLVLGLGLGFTAVAIGCLVRARLPGPVNVYAGGVILLPFLSAVLGPRPRFVLVAFPLFIAIAMKVRNTAFLALLATSAALMPLLLVHYSRFFLVPGIVPP